MLPNRWMSGSFDFPFDRLMRFRNEIDRVFERVYGDEWTLRSDDTWTFPVDLTETGGEYRYVFEVPGFTREELDVTLENGVLTVSGERHAPMNGSGGEESPRHRHWERRYGRFARSVRLPGNAVTDELDATCENGLLTVVVPKSQEARPRRIRIEAGGGQRQLAESTA